MKEIPYPSIKNCCTNCVYEGIVRKCRDGSGVVTWVHCPNFRASRQAMEELEKARELRRRLMSGLVFEARTDEEREKRRQVFDGLIVAK